ncbi:Antirestriction protein (ArdA) [uncultured Clostridium sp.]
MASLRDTVKQYQEELRDGIAWIAFWREGRSWNGEDFYLDTGDSLTAEQKSRLEEIRQKDPAAVILNSYYCGYLAGDMTVDELTAGVRRHYENGYNDVVDFIAAHDDILSPEVLEKARALAHAAGLPFYEKPYNGEEIDPYIYDGYMSIEDYELMHQKIEQERSEHLAEQFSILIDSRSRFETGQPGGVWLSMPTTMEQFHKAMNRIGITAENSQDFFINGFANTEQQPFDVPLSVIQSAGIDELNYFGKLLEMQGDTDRRKFAAAVTLGEYAGSVKDLINLAQNLDCYWIYPSIQDEEAYGHYLIDELDELELPEAAKNYFMYEEYGRDAVKNDGGIFTAQGYIYNNKNTFSEWYSGHENDIPKEYRVMSFPQPERPDPAKVEMDAAAPPQQSVPPDAAQEPRPVIPIVLTSEKPADKLKEITDRLEQGIMELFDSDRYKEYLRVMSKFHNYSFNNTLLIAMQKPDASLVAGFQSWKNNFKRNVVKGEKGIKILAPSPFKIKQEMEKIDPATQKPVIGADGKPVKEEKEITIPAFKVVSVFDVSQTEGKELPDIAVDMLTGDVECFKDVFAALEKTSPVPIGFEKIEGNSHGYYHLEEKRIAIDEGMSELQTIKTAIHEIAHAKLHDIDPNAPKEERAGRPDRRTREVQAESVAYAVCQHYGLDTSDYSFGYVAGWSSGRELDELKSSLETIRSTAAEIINSIDEHLQEIQKERDKEQAQKGTTIEAVEPDKDTFSIYQLKRGDETRDFRFEPYDRLAATGHTAEQTNYDLIYTAELAPGTSLEDIYTRFNIDHPKDFKGHSLSVSDVVVLHQNGQDTAHYVDSSGYRQVPEFLQPPEKENPLKHVEDTIEQNDNHFDGIINNTPSVDELEKKAKSGEQISLTDLADAIKAEKTHGKGKEEKPSIRAQLKADKKKAQKKTARQKSQNLERS